jgi:hypothetical protein
MNEFFAAVVLVAAAFYVHNLGQRGVPNGAQQLRADDDSEPVSHETPGQQRVKTTPPPVATQNVIIGSTRVVAPPSL